MTTTPRPWSLDTFEPMSNDHSQWETCTVSGAGTPGTIATKVGIENAALIVLAVNTFDEAKAALDKLTKDATLANEIQHNGIVVPATVWAALYQSTNEAKAVLAKLEGT
mgnify:CR=1 FL=1